MDVMPYVVPALLAVLLGVLLDIAVSARGIRAALIEQNQVIQAAVDFFMFLKGFYQGEPCMPLDSGFSIWVFRGGDWKLVGNYCRPGYEPGPPPSRAGAFEGYAVKQLGVKMKPK